MTLQGAEFYPQLCGEVMILCTMSMIAYKMRHTYLGKSEILPTYQIGRTSVQTNGTHAFRHYIEAAFNSFCHLNQTVDGI